MNKSDFEKFAWYLEILMNESANLTKGDDSVSAYYKGRLSAFKAVHDNFVAPSLVSSSDKPKQKG